MIPYNPPPDNRLRVVRLTPSGRGAVASMLLRGPKALNVFLARWKGPDVTAFEARPVFGRFRLENTDQVEEIVVHAIGPEEIEIHCHGGDVMVSAIEASLVHDGATATPWTELWSGDTQRDRAIRLLPFAPTERTAQILLDQYHGALERELSEIELLPEGEKRRRRARLDENARLGRHLVDPFRVVLAGGVNAGKSSLLNAILGYQRVIVHRTPGTTRDVVSSRTALDGFPVEFLDTAGFRDIPDLDELERLGIERSTCQLGEADLVVWVIDSTLPPNRQAPIPELENLLICRNKMDLPGAENDSDAIPISAATGEGVEELLARIVRRLVPNPPAFHEAVPLERS